MYECVCCIEQCQKNHSSYDIKGKVNCCNSLCSAVCAYGGQNRRYAGSYVLTHDNRNCCPVGNRPGLAKSLQDSHGSGGTLDRRSKDCSCRNSKHRIAEHGKDVYKFRHICQRLNCRTHNIHAVHQNRKADEYQPDVVFFLAFHEHHKNDCNRRKYR